ncbi:ubiquitin carboxyl-terminal hydrolase 2-like [Panicum miliaceum]|uniref:Ubiquitin carboxyl-terminal hydrolase 2-like n=1 Tax=Panicum miliaceum TaxID=4540 RepID=A0A3L6QXU6_PANMI|nr:ubiquitin carboxyl-terminal hydrolase 2-like [Panicum miliaceum]
MVASINGSTSVVWDQTERDHHGKAEEKGDLFSAHDNQNASTLNQGTRMQIELKNTAHQVGESPNNQKGRQANKAIVLSTLPPVLTLHVARFVDTEKRLGHAKFDENLDVGEYLDPRSEDKKDARYRLVGVIEHIGNSLKQCHYVAYVRGSRTGSKQQQSSGSSTWFHVSDSIIREVSLANVLKCEAYLLFYEKIED